MSTSTAPGYLRLIGFSGTNKVMAGELSRLTTRAGISHCLPEPRKDGLGSLVYPFDPHIAALAVRYHRTSTRVLWDLYESRATRLEPLYDDLVRQIRDDDRGWGQSGYGISVTTHGVQEFAAGERQIVGTVKNALIDGSKQRQVTFHVNPNAPDLWFDVRLRDQVLAVSIDLAGRPMSQRGYRRIGGVAPLNESLAAVLVMLSRHQPRTEPLVDPMAGSGTIAIEAACMGRATPVWVAPRTAACEKLPALRSLMTEMPSPLFPDTQPIVIANELTEAAHSLCKEHVSKAGASAYVHSLQGDFRHLDPRSIFTICRQRGNQSPRGLILTNPPYGERLKTDKLQTLYR
ncbi:MAG TPA: hypothetical protein PLV85_21475, partial [Polyangiaceae bacterium]|nr:hypothetical protein [Polyangiaceae bacterium]